MPGSPGAHDRSRMTRTFPIVVTAALALVACRSTPPEGTQPPPTGASCDAAGVQDVVGKPRSDALAEDARRRSGARSVRYLTPDMMVTMEYRGDRLNLHVGKDGRIGSARCG